MLGSGSWCGWLVGQVLINMEMGGLPVAAGVGNCF